MTTAREGFHSMTVTGDDDGNAVVVELDMFREQPVDVNNDPRFLGDPPQRLGNGGCSRCDDRWLGHVLNGVDVSARVFHRFDIPEGGIYADETEEWQR